MIPAGLKKDSFYRLAKKYREEHTTSDKTAAQNQAFVRLSCDIVVSSCTVNPVVL